MNTKTLMWVLGSVVGVLLIVVIALVVNRNPTSQPLAESLVSESNANSTSETEERPTAKTPMPTREEIRFVATYLRAAVQSGQHYVRVEETLAGPTPCLQDSLKVVIDGAEVETQWAADDRLEIFGAYQVENGTCSIVLDQESHQIKQLPALETPSEPDEPLVEAVQPRVSLVGTISALSDDTVFFRVDQVLGGEYACPQAAVVLQDPSTIVVGAQYEITGSYTPQQLGNCRLQLLHPAAGLRLLALPAPTPPEVPSATDLKSSTGQPFFVSAGISFLDPMPIFAGAIGFKLTEQIRGMMTAGFGSSAVELKLPSGEPISAQVNATLIEVAGLYNVSGQIHLGLSGGMLLLSGDYDLPFPVQGAASFNAGIPLLGAVLGYDLGIGMLTLGVQIPLGG